MRKDVKSILDQLHDIYAGDDYEINRIDIKTAIEHAEAKHEINQLHSEQGLSKPHALQIVSEKYGYGFYKTRSLSYR